MSCPVFSITAGGTGLAGASDQFFFLYQTLTGDGSITLRIEALGGLSKSLEAGLMIRESLKPDARFAALLATRAGGFVYRRRAQPAGASVQAERTGSVDETWLKLERHGSSVTASTSTDGYAWTSMGTDTVSLTATLYVGAAVASVEPASIGVAVVSNVVVSTLSTLPAGWASADIGDAPRAGSASFTDGSIMASSSGAGVVDTSDRFRFIYARVRGDLDLVARVAGLQGGVDRQAGVMIRESLTDDAPHTTLMLVGSANGVWFERRTGSRLPQVQTRATTRAAPIWFKLERRGSMVNAYYSTDGAGWTPAGSEAVLPSTESYVGLAVAGGQDGLPAAAAFDQISVQAVAANRPPTVAITTPVTGGAYVSGDVVTVTASASDPDDQVSSVDFFVNGAKVASDTAVPYSASWTVVASGSYDLWAVARDFEGASTTSATVTISVAAASTPPANQPPTVSITAPVTGRAYASGATVSVTASASDPDDSVAGVDFFVNGAKVATDVTAPYSASWTVVGSGNYSLWAVARDSRGLATTSATVTISVAAASSSSGTATPPANQPPTVSITAPVTGRAYASGATVSVTASASDPDDSVAGVDFFVNGAKVATDVTAPYSASWTVVGNGNYSLWAVARDSRGLATTSAPVTISVGSGTPTPTPPPAGGTPSGGSAPPDAPAPPEAPPATGPWQLLFEPSVDHQVIDRYVLEIYTAASGTLVLSRSLGKPAVPPTGVYVISIDTDIAPLSAGEYDGAVRAVSKSGSGLSASYAFSK